jgi:predicted  nucleic acid-binding Zn-ribbon protein
MIPQGNETEATFQVTGNGKFDLKLTDTDSQDSTETFSGNITLLKDQKPFVRIIEPMETSYATPDANVKITALAEDDYGVSKLEIFRGLNDSRFRSTDIPVATPAPTQFPGVTNLKLDDYGLQPGDVVKLFAHVLDNDPAGAKGAQSTVVTINVVSQKDMDRMMMTRDALETLQSKYSQAARKLEAIRAEADRLTKELAAANPNTPLTEEQQKELAKLAKDLEAAAKDMDKLADHDLPIDLDKALKDQLKQMAATLKDAGQLAGEASKSGMSVAGALDKLKAINSKCNGEQKDFDENAEAPLEFLGKIFPLLQDQERFLEIYQQQKDLAERMQAMADKKADDDPSVKAMMRDMRDEQHALRDQLQHLLDDIDDHVAQLPDDKRLDDLRDTARKFTAAVRSSPADTQMQASENSLDQFNGNDAVASARDAEETLDKFIARCQGMGDKASACLKFQPKLAAGLGNSISQMLSLSMGGAGIGGQGYSANANSLMKVGLYGTIPLMGKESRGGGKQADHGVGSAANGSPNGQPSPDAGGTNRQLNANGAGDAPIPPEYKKRVGDYFQRVEDELSQ